MHLEVLPLAFAMMIGPQILSAIVLVTGKKPVKTSLAYVLAIGLSIGIGVTISYLLSGVLVNFLPKHNQGPDPLTKVIQLGLVILLACLALRTYVKRDEIKQPKWLSSLQDLSVAKAFKLGVLVIFLMPTDALVMLTVGVNLASNKLTVLDALPFILTTVLIAALPVLFYLIFQKTAQQVMPRFRVWMNKNSWFVNILIYALFILLIIS